MTYNIGGETYIQKPLVLGQLIQLTRLLNGSAFPESPGVTDIIAALGNRLPLALAIVLIPEGTALKDKDVPALASDLEFMIDPETAIQVVNDFFDCNPINSVLEQLTGMAQKITAAIPRTIVTGSSAPSPEEILPGAIASSGDTP